MLSALLDLHDRQAKFADRLGDAFIMLRSLGVEQLYIFLVYAHEPAVADHVGREDRCELTSDLHLRHVASPTGARSKTTIA